MSRPAHRGVGRFIDMAKAIKVLCALSERPMRLKALVALLEVKSPNTVHLLLNGMRRHLGVIIIRGPGGYIISHWGILNCDRKFFDLSKACNCGNASCDGLKCERSTA